jgi:hypothetical protein
MRYFFSEEIVPMFRFRKFLPLVAVLVGTALLGAPTPAWASYSVEIFENKNGGAWTLQSAGLVVDVPNPATPLNPNSMLYGVTTADGLFSITGTALSNNPGTAGGALLTLGNTSQITTNSSLGGNTYGIEIVLSQTSFTAPTTTPLSLSSSSSGTIGGTAPGTLSVTSNYQGDLDPTNTLFGNGAGAVITPPTTNPIASQSTAVITGTASGTGTFTGTFGPGTSSKLVPSTTPFSLQDVQTFFVTASNGSLDTFGATDSTTASAVPGPAGVVLVIAGLPILGFGTWMRRRRQVRLTAV